MVEKSMVTKINACIPPHRGTVMPGCSCVSGVSKKGCTVQDHRAGVPVPELHLDYKGYYDLSVCLWQPLLPRRTVLESEPGQHETIRPESEIPLLKKTVFSPCLDESSSGYLKPPSRHALLVSDPARVFYKYIRPEDAAAEIIPHIRKNTDRHEVIVVHEGRGFLETAFGVLPYSGSDYLVIPKGLDYRLVAHWPSVFLIFELKDYPYPACVTAGDDFPFSEKAMVLPQLLPAAFEKQKTRVLHVADIQSEWHFYDSSPFATMAWSGYYYPYAISFDRVRSLPESSARGLDRHLTFVAVNEAGLKTSLIYTVRPFFHGSLRVYEDPQYDTLWFSHRKGYEKPLECEEGEFVVYPRGLSYHYEDHAGEAVSIVLQTIDRLHVAHNYGTRSVKGYNAKRIRRSNPDYQ